MTTKRVLIVEDEDDIRLLLSEVLGDAGFEVTEAETGDQAIQLLDRAGRFDLVMTDLSMPGAADGNAVAIRAKGLDPHLPVIYASGRPDQLRNNVGAGDAFVHKPFSLRDVVRVAQMLLAGRRP